MNHLLALANMYYQLPVSWLSESHVWDIFPPSAGCINLYSQITEISSFRLAFCFVAIFSSVSPNFVGGRFHFWEILVAEVGYYVYAI